MKAKKSKKNVRSKKVETRSKKIARSGFQIAKRDVSAKKGRNKKHESDTKVSRSVGATGRTGKGNQRLRKGFVSGKPASARVAKTSTGRATEKAKNKIPEFRELFDGTRERKDDLTGDMIEVPSEVIAIDLPKGTFEEKVAYIRNYPTNKLIKLFRSKDGKFIRSYMTTLTSHYKGKDYSRHKLTPPDFAVFDGEKFKQFLLDRLIQWQDNYIERQMELGETDSDLLERSHQGKYDGETGSDRALAPNRVAQIVIKINY